MVLDSDQILRLSGKVFLEKKVQFASHLIRGMILILKLASQGPRLVLVGHLNRHNIVFTHGDFDIEKFDWSVRQHRDRAPLHRLWVRLSVLAFNGISEWRVVGVVEFLNLG